MNFVERLRITAALTVTGALGAACSQPEQPTSLPPAKTAIVEKARPQATIFPTPTVEFGPQPATPIAKENKGGKTDVSSAIATINRLEAQTKPLDATGIKQLSQAAAELYCSATPCKYTPAELVNRIHFVPNSQFNQAIKDDPTRAQPTSSGTSIEFVNGKGEIYFDADEFKKLEESITPDVLPRYRGKNPAIATRKTTILHAIGHLHESNQDYQRKVSIPSLNVQVIGFTGFQPIYLTQNGGIGFIFGTNEAADEAATAIIAEKNGGFYHAHPAAQTYREGASLILAINKLSGIQSDEYLQYQNGSLNIEGLLKKWGALKNRQNPDIDAAIQALVFIGLRTQTVHDKPGTDSFPLPRTIQEINRSLNITLSR